MSMHRQEASTPTSIPPTPVLQTSSSPTPAPPASAPPTPHSSLHEGLAAPADAAAHFEALLSFETDCWDVSEAIRRREEGFVVLDVRSPALYAAGHVPTAVNLPHRKIVERTLESHPADTLFVVYCAGPACNGADRAALRLARLGRRVKKMIGGIEGWKDEGLGLVAGDSGA